MAKRAPITSPYAPDADALRAWLEEMVASMKLVELITAIVSLVTRMREINTELMKQLAGLRSKRPRSETLKRIERQLAFPGVLSSAKSKDANDANATEPKEPKSRRGRHPGRAKPPAHLPRIPVDNPVPPEMRICPKCGSQMQTVGHSTCEILEIIPARIVVMARRDETVSCPHDDTIVSAPTPPQIVERGKLGPKLIVEAVADKYIEHQPIERQATRMARAGAEVAPQTLGRSVAAAIDLLAPVAKLIHEQTLEPGVLGTDTSAIPVLDREAPEGIRTGSMACWTNACWVSFVYSRSGDTQSVKRFLGRDFTRTVQCDGASITHFIERAGGQLPGCWAHGRRYFAKAARSGDSLGLDGLRLIRDLFVIERESCAAGDSADERRARRQRDSVPVLARIRAWVDEQRAVIPPKTPLGQALGYLHNQWKRLVLFLDNGHVELTNNRRERELRKLVLGRKNWLFTWEDVGGERTASILTIIGTCIAHELDPRAYLHTVVELLLGGWKQSRLRELLPDRIVQQRPELSVSGRVDALEDAEIRSRPS